jgi:hypothetical protein
MAIEPQSPSGSATVLALCAASAASPAIRVMLDRRIAEERMIALDPPFEHPDWLWTMLGGNGVPHAFLMDATGAVSPRWKPLDEVSWTDVVAVRIEDRWGNPLDPSDFEDDGEYY